MDYIGVLFIIVENSKIRNLDKTSNFLLLTSNILFLGG